MREPQPFHRLFGLSWMDFFQGTSVTVEIELDLSLKQQFIDLVIIRNSNEPIPRRLPDGFDDLAAHNLVTFKSHRGALDAWALWELIGHFVNYRKQSSPSLQDLSPEEDYRLIAVCARFPHNLSGRIPLAPLGPGVYQASGFGLPIRVVVASQLPSAEHNAMLHLFSAKEELLRFGQAHYRPHSPDTSSLLYNLFRAYCEEPTMPDQLKEFVRQTIDEILQSLPPEERLKGLPPEERLRGLSADEVAKALPPDVLRALARRLKENGNGE
ncbi:MAG: hypothetical protein NZ700_03300 [Gemmataceae bacterium]|nr:hypothetical protein [Gemmataceae bacterium]MDW8267076.1 hypothetical protein [Gemmataceae bacterium]